MTDTNTIILCPGQGAQAVGMGQGWFNASPEAKATFDEANDTLGFDLAALCFDGPADDLNRTDNAQCAIYTASVACFRALKQNGSVDTFTATAGLSLGLVALYLALLPKPAHAFYWLTGAATNQLALITLLLSFGLLLRDPKTMVRSKRIASMVAAALCVAASVGSYDTTMLMLLGLLAVGLVVALLAKDARRLPWAVALAAGLIGAAVVMLAPGNGVRGAMFEKASLVQAIDYSLTNALKWLVPYLLSPAVLVAGLLFLPAGWALSRRLRAMSGARGGNCRWMLGLVPLWGLMIVCAWLPAQYMMQGNPPPRTLNPVSMFVLVGVFASIVVVLAQKPDGSGAGAHGFALPRGVLAAARVALALALLTQGNGNTALVQLKGEAGSYDRAMQQRYATIREAKARGETHVEVPPSPVLPTLLIHKELSGDPLDYPNWAAARYWALEQITVIEEASSYPEPTVLTEASTPAARLD